MKLIFNIDFVSYNLADGILIVVCACVKFLKIPIFNSMSSINICKVFLYLARHNSHSFSSLDMLYFSFKSKRKIFMVANINFCQVNLTSGFSEEWFY